MDLVFISGATRPQPRSNTAKIISAFQKSAVDTFTGPEYMSKREILMYHVFGKHISRFFMGRMAKKPGCKAKRDAKPYALSK